MENPPQSVRELLNQMRADLMESPPADALATSDYIVKLTAILGNIHDEMGRWERQYIARYKAVIDADPKMASDKQKIVAMDHESYHRFQDAKRYSELCLEMIAGLKYRARALQGEYGESHQQ